MLFERTTLQGLTHLAALPLSSVALYLLTVADTGISDGRQHAYQRFRSKLPASWQAFQRCRVPSALQGQPKMPRIHMARPAPNWIRVRLRRTIGRVRTCAYIDAYMGAPKRTYRRTCRGTEWADGCVDCGDTTPMTHDFFSAFFSASFLFRFFSFFVV